MITLYISCAMCGEDLNPYCSDVDLEPRRADSKPHYDFDDDLRRIAKEAGWIYQEEVCGDMYCSEKCAE